MKSRADPSRARVVCHDRETASARGRSPASRITLRVAPGAGRARCRRPEHPPIMVRHTLIAAGLVALTVAVHAVGFGLVLRTVIKRHLAPPATFGAITW